MASNVPIGWRRAFLRSIYWDAKEAFESLYDALKSVTRARITDTSKGRVLVGTAANGKSASYSIPSGGHGITPTDISALLGDFIDLYDASRAALVDSGVVSPTDDRIHTEMLDRLQPVTSFTSSFSGLRA